MFLKNSSGQKSASFTMMAISFIVVTLWLLLSIFQKIGHYEIRAFSGSEAMNYFLPLAALYFGRRYTDGKFSTDKDPNSTDPEAKP